MNIQPVLREQNLSIRVAFQIEEMIRSGELKVGDKIPPQSLLCEKFKVSRTVIREATRFLMAKGLLYSKTGNGTFVRSVDSGDVANSIGLLISLQEIPDRIEHLIEVRRALEIQIAQSAAERASPMDIKAIEANLRDSERVMDSPEEFAKKDLEFHFLLARATHNPLFEIILSPLIEVLLEAILIALKSEEAVSEAFNCHSQIFKKIKAKDLGGAGREMANHLAQNQKALLGAFRIMNFPAGPFPK